MSEQCLPKHQTKTAHMILCVLPLNYDVDATGHHTDLVND